MQRRDLLQRSGCATPLLSASPTPGDRRVHIPAICGPSLESHAVTVTFTTLHLNGRADLLRTPLERPRRVRNQ